MRYIKNLSTFRLILLFVLAVSAGMNLYIFFRGGDEHRPDEEGRQHLIDVMMECADTFGSHIAAQESLAVGLAMQYEILENRLDSVRVNQVLKGGLESAPAYVQGVGVVLEAPTEEDSRVVAFLPRNRHDDNLPFALREMPEYRPMTAREVNMDRRMLWTLIPPPSGTAESGFSSLLFVSVGKDAGGAIIRAELEWIGDILRKLRLAGARNPLCITPDNNVLWLENDRMFSDTDLETGDNRVVTATVARAKLFAEGRDAGAGLIKADILGSGWHLLLLDATGGSPSTEALSIPLIIMLVTFAVLLLDALVTSNKPNNMSERISRPKTTINDKPGRGLMTGAYNLLFRYRMTDPSQTRIDSELRVARQIQFSLVPDTFPVYSEWREFDLYSLLSPAREVGGDYYDFFMLDSDRMLLAVGDVSGKGVPAALYMAVCRTAFRTLAREADNPGELMSRLNDLLVRDNQSGLYVTLVCFIVNLPTGECEYAIAGHPAPLWHERRNGTADFIENPRETFVGMKAGLHFPVDKIKLNPGDTLLLYTDGVTEARNEAGEEFDYSGIQKCFLAAVEADRCQSLISGIETSVRQFLRFKEQEDDITLLAFRYWGPGGQKMIQRRKRASGRGASDAT